MINASEQKRSPPYQHPLVRPSSSSTFPSSTTVPSQQIPPPVTFDQILPASKPSSSQPGTPDKPGLLNTLAPQPTNTQPDPPHESRTARFLARFRAKSVDPVEDSERQPSTSKHPTRDRRARKELRTASRERVQRYKADKKEAQRHEKARTQWLGGLAWGFDPTAGKGPDPRHVDDNRVSCSSASSSARGDRGRARERDSVGGPGIKDQDSEWGTEAGGPGKDATYWYGLKPKHRECTQRG
ncbi:uncharacterized protein HMPREF1541_03480 [Cyphellophora europaea CBS 101466]|uniref:Uncharacterized protein n=1 Tax=Cyphellophora europaea (strain CBS 101466) TaxID=1220924 RepID=W2S0R9_CYPE1|nr:uncharacterized protein HMPREF1541_03480 [Cyphellophora europaea CBS 101466]ETN41544.1 hypothetical protein HMPREF1541_03480 [Cyphellophora europaea CBS 101466]